MPDNNEFINWLSSCGFNGSQQIVVYDDSFGAMASRLWWLLKGFGHEAVALLDGGWQNWLECGYEVSHKKPGITAKNYTADFDQNYIVTTEDVVNNFEYPKFGLIDVRAAERFNGVVEPIDSIAGHIPGAINIPLTENLDSAGRYKSSDALRELYKNLQKQWPSNQQVFMCGSGVTACHSLLALSVAGFDLPKVYAGSWSEWIRDLSRPMVKQSL